MSWRKFIRRRWWDEERGREIAAYLETETVENIARGMPPADAAAAARRKFGNPGAVREEIYRMNTIDWLESTWQDLHYAARGLRRAPGFAAVAILSLALGMGANTAIFQLLDAVRLRSLPVVRPKELAEVKIAGGNHGMGLNQQYGELTRPLWDMIRDKQQAFAGTFAWCANQRYIGRGSEMRHFDEMQVSGDFFRVLGVPPFRGRLLGPQDEGACPSSTAVASYAYWQSELGGRDIASGIKVYADNELLEIVGVTPPEFFGMAVGEKFDLALPFCQPKDGLRRDIFEVSVMGRLRPGGTIERASAAMDVLSPGIFEATIPPGRDPRTIQTYKHFRLAVYPASGGVSQLREQYDKSLWLLLGITGLVLLIACANLANLMLARSSARGREIAIRLALGASRGRLLRHLLAESGLLALAGGALGIALAGPLSRVLIWSITPEGETVNLQVATDWRVLLFAAAAAILACIIFGALPALRASNSQPAEAMKTGGRGMTAGRERLSLERIMVVTQISVSLLLLVGALLFVRSFRNLMTFNPGMRVGGITAGFLGFWQSNVPPDRWLEYKRELLEEVRATPGVLDAATTSNAPLLGSSWEHGVRVGSVEDTSKFTWVSPGYFNTMGIPVVRGRGFDRNDTAASTRVAVVNQTFVRRLLAGADPIGRTLRTGQEPGYPSTVYEIVGVIPDTQYNDLRGKTPPMTFEPASQLPSPGPWTGLLIHSNIPAAALSSTIKRRLAATNPDVIAELSDFEQDVHNGLAPDRLMAMLTGFFGILAAVLAMIGLYGVISYMVARRRNEIGIRVALGAKRGQIVSLVMRESAYLLAIGIAIGMAVSLAAGRSAGSLLFGLKPYDAPTLLAAAVLLAVVAAAASFVPARRASKLDPMAALRDE
ncbi:MAG TPA: ABC transporter permease [Bryobacteraceae bacterium]|nr:ABC transporter permease [Bryobacteraceae bacterium]